MTDVLSHPVRKLYAYRAPELIYRCQHCVFVTDRVMTGIVHAAVEHGYHSADGGKLRPT